MSYNSANRFDFHIPECWYSYNEMSKSDIVQQHQLSIGDLWFDQNTKSLAPIPGVPMMKSSKFTGLVLFICLKEDLNQNLHQD